MSSSRCSRRWLHQRTDRSDDRRAEPAWSILEDPRTSCSGASIAVANDLDDCPGDALMVQAGGDEDARVRCNDEKPAPGVVHEAASSNRPIVSTSPPNRCSARLSVPDPPAGLHRSSPRAGRSHKPAAGPQRNPVQIRQAPPDARTNTERASVTTTPLVVASTEQPPDSLTEVRRGTCATNHLSGVARDGLHARICRSGSARIRPFGSQHRRARTSKQLSLLRIRLVAS